jgi:hypothetical protein
VTTGEIRDDGDQSGGQADPNQDQDRAQQLYGAK